MPMRLLYWEPGRGCSKSLWTTSWCIRRSFQLLSANLLSVRSIPTSTLLMKILNNIGTNTSPWDTLLITGLHVDFVPLTMSDHFYTDYPCVVTAGSVPGKTALCSTRTGNWGAKHPCSACDGDGNITTPWHLSGQKETEEINYHFKAAAIWD